MIPANFVYGIFQSGYHRSSDPRYRPRRWSRHLGCHQPAGRLRQRQPRRECSWLIKKYKNKARTERPAAIPYSRGQIAEQTAPVNGQDARRICAAVDKCRPFHFCSR